MAIRFVDKPDDAPRRPAKAPARDDAARADGEARFATPIEAAKPVNPDASGELPFTDLPAAEKSERKKRAPKAPRKPDGAAP